MTIRARIVATLDALDLECNGDRADMQAALTAEIESNPKGELATGLKILSVAPTVAAIEELRDKIAPPFKPRVVGEPEPEHEQRELQRAAIRLLVQMELQRETREKNRARRDAEKLLKPGKLNMRDLPRLFVRMLATEDVTENQLEEICGEIDQAEAWRVVMDHVGQYKKKFPKHTKQMFLKCWTTFGGGIRTDSGDDLLLIMALRKLLPPYKGGDMILYRDETRHNRDRRTYGISWSAQPGLARSVTKETKSRIMLKAMVPAKAIIAMVPRVRDRYRENEFLVDRTCLAENSVQVADGPAL